MGKILRALCGRNNKNARNIKNIHMLVSIPSYVKVCDFEGYLKDKSTMLYLKGNSNLKYKSGNRRFCVSGITLAL